MTSSVLAICGRWLAIKLFRLFGSLEYLGERGTNLWNLGTDFWDLGTSFGDLGTHLGDLRTNLGDLRPWARDQVPGGTGTRDRPGTPLNRLTPSKGKKVE